MRASENPICLASRRTAAGREGAAAASAGGAACALRAASASTICLMLARNQGVMAVRPATSSTVMPRRSASATYHRRSACGTDSFSRSDPDPSSAPLPAAGGESNPSWPVSRERSAFCSDSLKVRPMAMTSPTDFICVVSEVSVPGNFSKAKRGTLTTQ